ncbi:MAG: division/cell wall cluster transcriptional repressor MraZ [Bacteroidia bacterium]|nr:MAG: division/cell wall cluster transcriptional repressor MraZ [Bacteroidia bacterium]PIE86419.1 MAG: division/cell wall cluster transcriptional repressor MraZ [Bacteroidia bacterium]
MTTFIGEFLCKIDVKGRLVLPAGLKKQLSQSAQDRFVVKKDIFEQCLVLFPMDEWEHQNKLIKSKLNPYNKEHNKLLRGFFKGAAEVNLDANNRILIPKRLLDKVEVEAEVYLIGQNSKIEIWSKKVYEATIDDDDDFAELAEKILGNQTFTDL